MVVSLEFNVSLTAVSVFLSELYFGTLASKLSSSEAQVLSS